MNLNILVGGAAGQGMDTIMYMVGRVLARGGYKFIATKDYMSRVRGGHNFSRLRISSDTPWSAAEAIDILIALNEQTYEIHAPYLKESGKVVYDPGEFDLPKAESRGMPVPLKEIAKESGSPIMANVVAVGALAAMLDLSFDRLQEIIRENFADKPQVVEGNLKALQRGAEEVLARGKQHFTLPVASQEKLLYIDGNQVLGMASLASGCRFLSAYPMTPSTGIMNYLAAKSTDHDVVVEQAEDEIAAINMALGASYGGVRSMTVTSGGGFALMVEGVSLAGMTETPLVVVLAMRPGPATGLPTRTEQGDLNFALYGGHGEFPRAILSATTHEDAFYRINKAFELADKYQIPVIFLSDQNFADTHRSVNPFDFDRLNYNRHLTEGDALERPYLRYRYTEDGISPRILPGQEAGEVVLIDSDEHDEKGNIIEDATTRRAMMDKRTKKLVGLAAEMEEPEYYGTPDAEILLVGWGSNYGVLREVVDSLTGEGLSVAMLHFSDIWPLPQSQIAAAMSKAKMSFCVENNSTGQFASLIRRTAGIEISKSILKYDGRPFFPREITEEVKKHV